MSSVIRRKLRVLACCAALCAISPISLVVAQELMATTAPSPASAVGARTTLAMALEAAWQRAVAGRESDAQRQRALAEGTAASSLSAAPPSLVLDHVNDRFQSSAGRRETEAGVVWPLWLPGQKGARQAAAGAELGYADASTAAARLRLAGQVREAAWSLAAASSEVDAAASQSRYLERISRDVDRRVKAGDLARADALAAQSEWLQAQSAADDAVQRLAAAQAAWQALTGLHSLPELAPPAAGASDTAATADDGHPESRAAIQSVVRARKRLDAVNASRRDPPELSVRYRQESPGYGEPLQRGIGIGLRIPFGTDGRNAPLQAAAYGDLDIAETSELRVRERLASDVAVARTGLQSAERQLDQMRNRAQLLRERAQLIDASFRAGETALPELLRAVNAAGQADAALVRQQAAVGMAHAQLQQSLGLLP